jgi:HemY protein
MISLLIRFALIVVLAIAFAWLADQPGDLTLRWLGYEIQTSLMAALITISIIALVLWIIWSVLLWILDRPGALGSWFKSRRQKKAREALSSGLIAVAAGDKDAAQASAKVAVSVLGNDPMAKLLDAQAAQMRGDSNRVRQLFEEMTQHPETRLLGLRGLHTEAARQQDLGRARQLAEEAARLNPKVNWASQAVLSYQSANEDWPAIAKTIDQQKQAKIIDRKEAKAKHAVVLMAQALEQQADNPAKAGDLAVQAHTLEPSLVPAAVMAATHLAHGGNLRKASRILEKTWAAVPHPDIAEAYGNVRAGDSALDRLKRVTSLTKKSGGIEAAVALATAAIEAREWKTARRALEPFAHDRPQARICGLMAEIEEGEFGDKGRAREWLSRAVRAPRDPAWTADGFISRVWLPVSPVTGELGAFRWRVPVEGIAHAEPEPAAPADEPDTGSEEHMPGDDAIQVNPEPDVEQGSAQPVEPEAAEAADSIETTDSVETTEAADKPEVPETSTAASEQEAEPAAENQGQDDQSAEQEQVIEPEQVEAPPAASGLAEPEAEPDQRQAARLRQPDDPGPESKENKKSGWL